MVNTHNFSDIFISYSRQDIGLARKIGDVLNERGYNIWADWEDIPKSADWWSEIQAGIESANTVAFLISPDSAVSDVCRAEIQHAVDNNKRIVPILYRDLLPEQEDALHPAIRTHNWLIFKDDDDERFEHSLTQLINVFVLDITYLQAHTRYLVRAREWFNRGKEQSFVLRGTDALEAISWLEQTADKSPPPTALHRQYIDACQQQWTEDTNRARREELMLSTERQALPTILISGGSAAIFIFLTAKNQSSFSLENLLTIAFGGLLVSGMFMAAITLFVEGLMPIRFPEKRMHRLLVGLLYGSAFGAAIAGVTQIVNYTALNFDWRSIFIMGFFFAIGFVLRATFQFNVWIAAVLVTISIQLGSVLTGSLSTAGWNGLHSSLVPIFYYADPMDFIWLGLPMSFFQAVGVYAYPMWEDIQRLLSSSPKFALDEAN